MSTREIMNYRTFIADLEKQRLLIQSEYKENIESINAAMEGAKKLLSNQEKGKSSSNTNENGVSGAPFVGLGVTEAVLRLFSISHQVYTAKEIENALLGGGFSNSSKNLYATLYTTLRRLRKQLKLQKAPGGKWKLKEVQQMV